VYNFIALMVNLISMLLKSKSLKNDYSDGGTIFKYVFVLRFRTYS